MDTRVVGVHDGEVRFYPLSSIDYLAVRKTKLVATIVMVVGFVGIVVGVIAYANWDCSCGL